MRKALIILTCLLLAAGAVYFCYEAIRSARWSSDEKNFASFAGSKYSNIYHELDCDLVNEIEEEDRIWFDATIANKNSRYEGKQYFPFQKCKPSYRE
ncbi:MAG: hypothetical protein P9M07_02655 [Candidatus Aceula meridiana]|nr:hypothetical protein [Candidatus Aceula meridiana]